MIVGNPTQKLKDLCKELGGAYTIRVIDLENVIYRDLGNGFDFEVSGADNKKKALIVTLYIWNNRKNQIVETISNIQSVEALKAALESSAEKYLSLDAGKV